MHVWHGAQAGQLLDRLVRRAVLAQADRIMGQHVDHPLAHDRAKPDRRPHVVGEDEERARVGDQAAVQRHPVSRSRHAVLANAEMDVAAGVIPRATVPIDLTKVRLEPVRSADPPISSGVAGTSASSALLARGSGGELGLVFRDLLLQRGDSLVPVLRQLTGDSALKLHS